MSLDEGGEAPCFAHLLEPGRDATTRDIADRGDIEQFVRDFYRQAAMDDVLGPVFVAAHVDWNAHIATLTDFWAWQLFGERGYEGNPLRAHEPVHSRTPFTPVHYERWLALFDETIDGLFAGPLADLAKHRAHKMASALRRLLAGGADAGDVPVEPFLTRKPRGGADKLS